MEPEQNTVERRLAALGIAGEAVPELIRHELFPWHQRLFLNRDAGSPEGEFVAKIARATCWSDIGGALYAYESRMAWEGRPFARLLRRVGARPSLRRAQRFYGKMKSSYGVDGVALPSHGDGLLPSGV